MAASTALVECPIWCAESPIPSFHNALKWWQRGSPPTSLPSLRDESALSAALHLAQLSCNKPTVCALHLSAWRSAPILAATSQGEERRRGEWTRDGTEREGGGWGTTRMYDGCSLAPALPSIHRGFQSLCRAEERMEGGCRDTSPGYQDEKWRRDKKERLSASDVKRKQLRDTEKGGGQWWAEESWLCRMGRWWEQDPVSQVFLPPAPIWL